MDGKGYELAHSLADENLRMGNVVIADSVNPWELTRKAWNNVAQSVGASFINIEVVCTNKVEHKARVDGRTSTIPGQRQPTWAEVLQRDYQEWSENRYRIDTSAKSIDESFAQLLGILDAGTNSNPKGEIRVRPVENSDRQWVLSIIQRWGGDFSISSGRKIYPAEVHGFIATDINDREVGLITYDVRDRECEIVTLDAFEKLQGIGTRLLETVFKAAKQFQLDRVFLSTTNDNLNAIRFYQKRGMRISAINLGAMEKYREMKPSIPIIGEHGIPIRDEIIFEMVL